MGNLAVALDGAHEIDPVPAESAGRGRASSPPKPTTGSAIPAPLSAAQAAAWFEQIAATPVSRSIA
jgi:hypothetical protein